MLNKQDTSIVTLALLLSIATSPVTWAASRSHSNSSAIASANLSESLLQSPSRTNHLNLIQRLLTQPEQKNVKPQAASKASMALNEKQEMRVETNSLLAQFNSNKKNLVGQSPQTRQSTLVASNGDIPVWLWWLVPVVPVLGLWLRFKLKQQASYSGTTQTIQKTQTTQSDRNSSPLSPKLDDLKEKSQPTTSSQVLHRETPLTQSKKLLIEDKPVTLVQNSIEAEPEVILDQSLTVKSSSEEQLNPTEPILSEPVQESILVEDLPQPEAEAVIAEFLNAKNTNLNQSTKFEPINSTQEKTIPSESLISESSSEEDKEEEPLTVMSAEAVTVEEEEPPIVEKIIEPEIISVESVTAEEEEPSILAEITEPEVVIAEAVTVEEEIAEPEIISSQIPTVEEEITEPEIVIAETPTVEEEIIEPEIISSEAVTVEEEIAEPEIISSETPIVEQEIAEPEIISSQTPTVEEEITEPEIVIVETPTVEEEIAEPEIISSQTPIVEQEIAEPEIISSQTPNPNLISGTPPEPELSIPHQDIRNETDVVAMKFNIGGQRKFEPSLADVDEGLPNLPNGYGQSKIILLPRDPNWAYAYWDVPNEHKERIRQQGGRYLLLRVYDVTGIDMDTQPPHWMQEYECDEMAQEWNIPVPMSDHDYIVELGYQVIDGRWLVLVRSNHIRIPPIYPTDWENYQFINVPWTEDLRGKTFFRL